MYRSMFPYIHFYCVPFVTALSLAAMCVFFACFFRSMSCGSYLDVDVKIILKWIL
jgi:hypothetical protein